jgi:hypothetical protein
MAPGRQHDPRANPGIAINDGAANTALTAKAQGRTPLGAVSRDLLRSLIPAGSEHDNVFEDHVRLNPGATPKDAAAEIGLGHETAFPTHDLIKGAVREVGRGQVAGVRIEGRAGIT